MTTYKRQDVVLIPFPFSDLSSSKQRHAIVLATVDARQELICMMLTSTFRTDYSVDIQVTDITSAGLPKPTVARTSRLFTITNELVRKKIGEISDSDFKAIIKKLLELLHINQ